jgi:hypothetical protein
MGKVEITVPKRKPEREGSQRDPGVRLSFITTQSLLDLFFPSEGAPSTGPLLSEMLPHHHIKA